MAGMLALRLAVPRTLAGSVLCLLWITKACSANCYWPNGTDENAASNVANLEDYAPCDAGAAVSMCCAIGPHRVAEGSADTCVADNRLCLSSNGETYWRESCTDPTWTDPACIHLYTSGNTDTTLTKCSDGSWCNGGGDSANGNQTCCELHDGYFILSDGSLTQTNPNSTTTSTMTTSTSAIPSSSPSLSSTTTTPGVAASSTPTPVASTGGLSTGVKTGLGVGIGVGVVALLALLAAYFLFRRRCRNREARDGLARESIQTPQRRLPEEMEGTPMYAEMGNAAAYSWGKYEHFRGPPTEPAQLE